MKPIYVSAKDLLKLLDSLPFKAVITKNRKRESANNFRKDFRKSGQWLNGFWKGKPRELKPNEGFVIHFVERDRTLWLGEYIDVRKEEPQNEGRYSLILNNVKCYEVVDWDEPGSDQFRLKEILKQGGPSTYSYLPVVGADKKSVNRSRMKYLEATLVANAYKMAEVKVRLQQKKFRDGVFGLHGARCIITGCQVQALLEAAHRPGRRWDKGHNQPDDGIPLRVDLHRALDAKLIRLNKENRLIYVGACLKSEYGQYLCK